MALNQPRVAIVSAGWGSPYAQGLARLTGSVPLLGPGIEKQFYRSLPGGCPDHGTLPFAFKHYLLRQAEKSGVDAAIWCDANCHFVRPAGGLVKLLLERGYWISTQGWNVGQWCTDSALKQLDLDRAAAFEIPMICAALYGLVFRGPTAGVGEKVLSYLEQHQDAMPGPFTNNSGEASRDEGVRGHRHDQTVLSVAWHRIGLTIDWPPCLLSYAYNNGKYEPPVAVAFKEGI